MRKICKASGFTPAGTLCIGNPADSCHLTTEKVEVSKAAFTLAEVLITLTVVGVVAALTIPALVQNISDRAKKAQKDTIEARLLEGFNQLNTLEDGFSAKYETTEDFVKALSKYYKISSICGADNLGDCWPQKTISNKDNVVTISNLDGEASDFITVKPEEWLPPASFINGQGTPFIMLFKRDCARDTGKAMRDLQTGGSDACVALLYDKNGTRMPNRIGDDISVHGIQKLAQYHLVLDDSLGVNIISEAFTPTPMTKSECDTEKSKYGISECCLECDDNGGDYWAGAMKACQDMGGRLPNQQELTNMAKVLYNDDTIPEEGRKDGGTLDTSKIPDVLSGLGSSWWDLWSSEEDDKYDDFSASFRGFDTSETGWYLGDRYDSPIRAVCVTD